jgi:glucosamine kinase
MQRVPLVTLPEKLTHPSRREHARYLLGIDGGATKTLAAVLDLEGQVLHVGKAGPSNEDAVGGKAAVQALLAAASEALEGAGIAEDELAATVAAVAGTNMASVERHVQQVRGDAWIVVNDVIGAWATATGGGPGVAAIAGTGSNVFGVGSGGRSWRTGGWGHLLGDEGSGYWLGVESIRAALRDRDASGPPTELSDAAREFFGCDTVEAVASLVYSKPLTKGEISAFAVETANHAERGDQVAHELMQRGATLLGGQIAAVIGQVELSGSFPVGLIGSAYKAGEMYLAPLRRRVEQDAPQADITAIEMAPVGGALMLAARACGQEQQLAPGELSHLLDAALAV